MQDVFLNIFILPDRCYIDGVSVYESRLIAGRSLAKHHPVDADLVVGVPESGNVAAMVMRWRAAFRMAWHCKEQLCRQNLYQAKAKQPRVKCSH